MTTDSKVDLIALPERVALLGRAVVRGDITRIIERLDAAGHDLRMELAASQDDPSLVALVDDYGAALVLQAVGRAAARLRRERLGLGGAS